MRFFYFLLTLFCTQCISAEIDWVIFNGFDLTTNERNKILNISSKLGISNIYQIKSGPISHFDRDTAIIVKGVVSINDTMQIEKWLYIWRFCQIHRNLSYLPKHIIDSSVVDTPFYSGVKCIEFNHRYIYRHGSQSKIFELYNQNYQDIKFCLDCILNGTASEDSMKWKSLTKDDWNKIKSNLLIFINVLSLHNNEYSFNYCLSLPECNKPENTNTEMCDMRLNIRIDNNKCIILYAGRGFGTK
jgi:hypothetical protein